MDHILSKGYKVDAAATVTRGVACKLSADDTVTTAAAGNDVLGVYQETVDAAKVTTGKVQVGVAIMGVTRVVLGGNVSRGDRLKADANGKAVTSAQVAAGAQPTHVFAIALTAGNSGDEIDALLTPGAVY